MNKSVQIYFECLFLIGVFQLFHLKNLKSSHIKCVKNFVNHVFSLLQQITLQVVVLYK